MSLLAIAFMLTAVVDIVGYYPQIKRVINPNHKLESISFKSFSLWTLSLFIAFLYAVIEVKDIPLAIVTGLDLLGCAFITVMVFFRRKLPELRKLK